MGKRQSSLLLPTSLVSLLSVLSIASGTELLPVELSPLGGIQRLFQRPIYTVAPEQYEPVPLRLTIRRTDHQARTAKVHFIASDFFNRTLAWSPVLTVSLPADIAGVEVPVAYPATPGYHRIRVTVKSGQDEQTGTTEFGVVSPPHQGLRPESFFACDTGSILPDHDLQLLQAIGIKVVRAIIQPEVTTTDHEWAMKPATGNALPLDFNPLDRGMMALRQNGLGLLPIASYTFFGSGGKAIAESVELLGRSGPPRNIQEYIATWKTIIERYPEVNLYTFGNDSEIFGPAWAATPEEYRRLQNLWCRMALEVKPSLRILTCGGARFIRDHLESFPLAWKGQIQGITHRPVMEGAGESNYRSGSFQRSLDDGLLITRRLALPDYFIVGTSDNNSFPQNSALQDSRFTLRNNPESAAMLVQTTIRAALAGAGLSSVTWNAGCGPDWSCTNTAIGVMTHFLEDRPIVTEIWPEHELIWGAIFANPQRISREVRMLPRSDELRARWRVPVPASRQNDKVLVAVIWSLAGDSNTKCDQGGTLTINGADDLRAFDLSGAEIKANGGQLILPFNPYPIYLMTDTLNVPEMRRRIATANLQNLTPLSLYAMSLRQPANQSQSVMVRMENQLNREITGNLTIEISRGGNATVHYQIPAAKVVDIAVPWPGITPNPDNLYGMTLTADSENANRVVHQQILQVAQFVKRTVTIDGNLNDWEGVIPVLLDSDFPVEPANHKEYLTDPHLEAPTDSGNRKRIIARVFTAYDDNNVYLAALVKEPTLSCIAGMPATEENNGEIKALPYLAGQSDGLQHISTCGDVLQFSFGFRSRVPNWGRQMDDPYAWKGHFYDTDYSFAAHISAQGDRLIRLWSAYSSRQDAYQLDKLPDVGQQMGGKIKIMRNESLKSSIYELSIPRSLLIMFDPAAGQLRFGFVLNNDEKLGRNGLSWSEVAGVFDHWYGGGSFPPSRTPRLPCQTLYGIQP